MPGKFDFWFNSKQILYDGDHLNTIFLCKTVCMNLKHIFEKYLSDHNLVIKNFHVLKIFFKCKTLALA